jgi:hypothetical protein
VSARTFVGLVSVLACGCGTAGPAPGAAGLPSSNRTEGGADGSSVPDASFDASSDDGGAVAEGAPGEAGSDGSLDESVRVSVLTQHNDVARTGANLAETRLTPANVNASQFGKLFCWSVDDEVYTQPLVVADVHVAGGGVHDAVYLATMSDSVYAFNASEGAASGPLWSRSLLPDGAVPVRNTDMTGACGGQYTDISGNIGVMGTPVVDRSTNTLYLVARTREGSSTFVQRLHAIDIRDGTERPNSPVTIAASVPGTGEGGTTITFDPLKQNQRSSLLLAGGVVYVAWASHCDWGPYHGWILGYDAGTLEQVVAYNATPDGDSGGIWMSGQGPAADANGSIYAITGNGTVGVLGDPSNARNRGESFLRLTRSGATLQVASWFTPHDYLGLNVLDDEIGSSGPLLVPDSNLVVSGSKASKLYALDRTSMGGLSPGPTEPAGVQTVALGAKHVHGSPVYWRSRTGPRLYVWAEMDHLKAFRLDPPTALIDSVPAAQSVDPAPDGMPGGMLSISANGEDAGILWAYLPEVGDANHAVVPGELRAFDATDVSVELWNSSQNRPRDSPGDFAKFTSPTVANGRVYLSTFSHAVCVYGSLPTGP